MNSKLDFRIWIPSIPDSKDNSDRRRFIIDRILSGRFDV